MIDRRWTPPVVVVVSPSLPVTAPPSEATVTFSLPPDATLILRARVARVSLASMVTAWARPPLAGVI